MISAFLNTVKIPVLRRRILFTLAIIVIVRLGAAITTPGVNQAVLQEWFRSTADKQGGVAALFNLFSGGALENCAIFSLGIMPYISASIMLQLLTAVIPQLGRLAREDGGRQKIMQYTRYATVVLCLFQGYLLAISFQHPESYHTILGGIPDTIRKLGIPLVADQGWAFRIATVITLTTGTLFLMWLGDQITERGIGNGISLIITVASAGSPDAGMENLCAERRGRGRYEPDESNPGCSCADDSFPVPGDRWCHHDHARCSQNFGPIRQARGRPKNVRRPIDVHAVESELRRSHADHFRMGHTAVSQHDHQSFV